MRANLDKEDGTQQLINQLTTDSLKKENSNLRSQLQTRENDINDLGHQLETLRKHVDDPDRTLALESQLSEVEKAGRGRAKERERYAARTKEIVDLRNEKNELYQELAEKFGCFREVVPPDATEYHTEIRKKLREATF